MYSIGQVSRLYDLPVSTLRYYDKEGLFPNLTRESGIRKFSDDELTILHMIECLKSSGLEIREIKQFFEWCSEGSATYGKRKELFEARKKAVEEEIESLNRTLNMLKYKCWYYEQALIDGSEDRIQDMLPDHLPAEIQEYYDKGHPDFHGK
ncbi:MAG: MerR family transcriptional regulator [Eubacterium sp.]|nr:MerR family transcriptional regulator [Eubacterium sp.]